MNSRVILALAMLAAIGGCGGEAAPDASDAAPGDTGDRRPFVEIGDGETVNFTGTEPFWGGKVQGFTLTYTTPESIEGTAIEVERFAGRGGVSYSGELAGSRFDMTITAGRCSDGMSDRTYPYTATLQVGGEQRNGCAWTDDNPRSAPPGYEP